MRVLMRPLPFTLPALLVTIMMVLSGCQSGPQPSEATSSDTVATVGKAAITYQQLIDRLLAEYGEQTLKAMMLAEAVNQEAELQGITVTPTELEAELRNMRAGYDSEEQFYKMMREQLGMGPDEVREEARNRLLLEKITIRDVKLTEAEIHTYMQEHPEQFGQRFQYRLQQIIVASEEEAAAIMADLAAGADFGEMAEAHSLDEFTADTGGELGWVEEHDPFLDESLLAAAAVMQAGEVQGPIAIGQGYAVLLLGDKAEVQLEAFEVLYEQAKRQLALGKAPSMREIEQVLLEKFEAQGSL